MQLTKAVIKNNNIKEINIITKIIQNHFCENKECWNRFK